MKKNVRRLSIEIGAKLKECLREEPPRVESNSQRKNQANSQGFTFDTPEQSENSQEQLISSDKIVSPSKETDATPTSSPSSSPKEISDGKV